MILLIILSCKNNDKIDTDEVYSKSNDCQSARFIKIETSDYYYCTLDDCGKIDCQSLPEEGKVTIDEVMDLPNVPFKDFTLLHPEEYAISLIAGCAIDLAGMTYCWGTREHNETVKELNNKPAEFLSIYDDANCRIYDHGNIKCTSDYNNEMIRSIHNYSAKWKFISVSEDLISGITYDDRAVVFNWRGNIFEFEEQQNAIYSMSLLDYVCVSNNEYTACWDYELRDGLNPENAHVVDYEHIGTQMCGFGLAILQHDGSVWYLEELHVFDEPLVSLSCPRSAFLCGLTAAGEGRCWTEERGYWDVLP